ncbi:hypothetical protein [uncultured Shewanella sp.]|uniref:hypothetical protein n=1 Tax=uncultured Shewanella sp. TaxID=173975 RepID=UPI002634173C|nr:hypothetical protein [uncultured Shewanella sp.]
MGLNYMESGSATNKDQSEQQSLTDIQLKIEQLIQQQPANKKPWYQNPEMIVAFSALVIGIVTTFTSIYSASIDRAYARASVWPSVEIARSHDNDLFKYIISNNGTGPAIIKYAKIQHGKQYLSKWRELDIFKTIVQSHVGKTVLPAQKTINPVIYRGDKVDNILAADNLISIELCYCSIYDECWLVNRDNNPQTVSQCVIDNNQRFLQ